jgi:hypothetical protein
MRAGIDSRNLPAVAAQSQEEREQQRWLDLLEGRDWSE